jgi:spore coat protein U-like protein
MNRFVRFVLLVTVALVAMRSGAFASTATTTFTVMASVVSSCTISAANLNFGNYDPVVANAVLPLNLSSTVTVACTKGDVVTIGLNAGLYSAHATGTTRAMSNGAATPSYLSYEIYQNAGMTTVWGNASGSWYTYTSAGKAATAIPDYGQVPAAQDQPIASYTDTITATVTF